MIKLQLDGRKSVGMLQWSGRCSTCKKIYRFTVEGILASLKVKKK